MASSLAFQESEHGKPLWDNNSNLKKAHKEHFSGNLFEVFNE